MPFQQARSSHLAHIVFLLVASIRPLRLLQVGQRGALAKVATNYLGIIPALEGVLFALRFAKAGYAILFIATIASIRFIISVGIRFSLLARTFPQGAASYTAADLLQAEKHTDNAIVAPAVAFLTTFVVSMGFFSLKSPAIQVQTCVLFLMLSELVERILNRGYQRTTLVVGFCMAQIIHCSPLVLVRM